MLMLGLRLNLFSCSVTLVSLSMKRLSSKIEKLHAALLAFANFRNRTLEWLACTIAVRALTVEIEISPHANYSELSRVGTDSRF
jgi:hypothetical protein